MAEAAIAAKPAMIIGSFFEIAKLSSTDSIVALPVVDLNSLPIEPVSIEIRVNVRLKMK